MAIEVKGRNGFFQLKFFRARVGPVHPLYVLEFFSRRIGSSGEAPVFMEGPKLELLLVLRGLIQQLVEDNQDIRQAAED